MVLQKTVQFSDEAMAKSSQQEGLQERRISSQHRRYNSSSDRSIRQTRGSTFQHYSLDEHDYERYHAVANRFDHRPKVNVRHKKLPNIHSLYVQEPYSEKRRSAGRRTRNSSYYNENEPETNV